MSWLRGLNIVCHYLPFTDQNFNGESIVLHLSVQGKCITATYESLSYQKGEFPCMTLSRYLRGAAFSLSLHCWFTGRGWPTVLAKGVSTSLCDAMQQCLQHWVLEIQSNLQTSIGQNRMLMNIFLTGEKCIAMCQLDTVNTDHPAFS